MFVDPSCERFGFQNIGEDEKGGGKSMKVRRSLTLRKSDNAIR